MEADKKQPYYNTKESVAVLAKANRLQRFNYQSLIVQFAKEFGMSPTKVEEKESFDTVIQVLWELKEEREYQERFNEIWRNIQE